MRTVNVLFCMIDRRAEPKKTNSDGDSDSEFTLSGCQTNDKVGQFRLPIKLANKNLSSVMQKSSDFNVQLEYALFSTRKSPNVYAVIRRSTPTS